MRSLALAILAAAALGGGCESKQSGDRPAPAGKPISPPAVEPLPAPRARGQLGSPAETRPETTAETAGRDAGAAPDAGADGEALTE